MLLFALYYLTATSDGTISISVVTEGSNLNVNNTTIVTNTQQYGMCDSSWQDIDGYVSMSVIDVPILTEIVSN